MRRRNRKRAKPGTRSRRVHLQQGTGRAISTATFMAGAAFVRGFADARARRPFDQVFVDSRLKYAVQYETGRLFALAIRPSAVLRRGRRWVRIAADLLLQCVVLNLIPRDRPRQV